MRNENTESLADYVRRILKEKNLSLRDVEENSGHQISNSYISKIISEAVRNPTVKKLKALARGLNEPEEKVMRFAFGRTPSEKHVFDTAEEEELQNIIDKFLALPEEDRKEFRIFWQMVNGEIDRRRRRKNK